jgi:hypothetical protein
MADEGLDWLLSLDVKQDDALSFLKTLDKMSAALKGTKTEVDQVEKATSAADEEFKQLSATLAALKKPKQIEELKKQIEEFSKPKWRQAMDRLLDPLLQKMKSVAEFEFLRRLTDKVLEAPGELIDVLKELGEEMISVAAKTERTNRSFELLFGAADGRETLEYIEGIAKYTEFTDDNLKSAAQSLAKVGFQGRDLTRALAASLDIAAFSPNKEEGMGEALASLERIKRTGRVDNRVLGGLGVGEKDFLKELSARTGQGSETLKKELEKGKVNTEVALETLYSMIAKKTGKNLGGAGVEMGRTLSAQLTHLRDLPDQFMQKLAKSPGLEILKNGIGDILEKLDPDSPTGQKISGFLNDVFTKGAGLLNDVDIGAKVDLFTNALRGFADIAGPVLRFAYHELEGIAYLIGRITGHIKSTEDQKKDIAGESMLRMESFRMAHGGQGIRVEKPVTAGDLEFNRQQETASQQRHLKALDEARAAFSSPGAFDDAILAMKINGEKMGAAAVEGMRGPKGIDSHSPSKKFAKLGEMAAAGFDEGFDSDVADVFRSPGKPARTAGINVGGVSVSVSVQGSSASAAEIGEATARAVESILPGALESALASIALQGGAN